MTEPLIGIRVVEFASGLAPAYAAKLFVDAGAEVWLVEPPTGDPLRAWSASGARPEGEDGALFSFLAASKRSVVGRPGDDHVRQLVAGADLVLEGLPVGQVEGAGGSGAAHQVITSITPFGRGSWQERPASELTIQAESGSLAARLYPEGALRAGGRVSEWAAGAYAAAASLVAVRHARGGGGGTRIDVSMTEVMCICTNLFLDLMWDLLGRPDLGEMGASTEFPAVERSADGWVGFNTNSAQMFEDFLVLVGRSDLAGDPSLRNDAARREDLERTTREWCAARTSQEIVELAALLRVPAVPVGHGANLVDNPHLRERRAYAVNPAGFTYPRPPYRLNGRTRPDAGPAPALGGHTDAIPGPASPGARAVSGPEGGGDAAAGSPLAGLKVLDMTCWWAGPGATQLLAGLGAEVIHVEAIQRMDGMRPAATLVFTDRDQWWEYSPFFLTINVNKKGITLDLDTTEGLDLARRLVGWADVVVENYTPRVMERFGLDAPGLHAINPQAVVVRMPAFGLDGPWRDRVGFAQTMEAMCGMAWVTGVPDGPPRLPRGPCDPIGAMHAAFAIMVALTERERTGTGQTVEAGLLESGLNVAAEQVIEHSAYGRLLGREGNRSPEAVPEGVFLGRDGRRLALSVQTDSQWAALTRALGRPDWAADPALGSRSGRRRAEDAVEEALAAWVSEQDADQAAGLLLGHGIPAAVVADFRNMAFHPLMVERGFFETCDHPVVGPRPMFGMPFRYDGVERWIRSPAPLLGQHNREVLGGILGLEEADIDRLEGAGVIGTRPVGI